MRLNWVGQLYYQPSTQYKHSTDNALYMYTLIKKCGMLSSHCMFGSSAYPRC